MRGKQKRCESGTSSLSRCHDDSAPLKMALHSMRKARECWNLIRALHQGPEAALAPQVTEASPSSVSFPSHQVVLIPLSSLRLFLSACSLWKVASHFLPKFHSPKTVFLHGAWRRCKDT